ncbi:hypothetical protein LCGC14_1596880 [marine sediment metagenome]|uniref:Uncharacterized protein n=1 Tax=marine sediment metagenome TaxID=412755 RepID=A0A0F9ICQ0_9ZZZZ
MWHNNAHLAQVMTVGAVLDFKNKPQVTHTQEWCYLFKPNTRPVWQFKRVIRIKE